MSLFVNTLSHRIIRNGEPVEPGQPFESDAKFDKETFPAAEDYDAVAPESDETIALDRKQQVNDVSLLGRSLSTAALRDRLDPETETTVKGTGEGRLNNQPSAGGPAEIVREDAADPNAPAPINAGDSVIRTGAPGSDVAAGTREHSAESILDRLDSAEGPALNAEEEAAAGDEPEDGPTFASEAAEKKAAELDVDASAIKGTGSDGDITVADVKKAAAGDE